VTTALRLVTGTALRERLLDVVHRVLSQRDGAPPLSRAECAARSFASLGMDSLAGAELTVEIEEELGLELLPTDVFAYNDLDSLTRFIEGRGSPEASRPEYSAITSQRSLALGRMIDDAVLPPDVQPVGRSTVAAVLVTGATGFVGAHIVAAVLRDTSATVYCLIRAADGDPARAHARLQSALEQYDLWSGDLVSRLEVVVADISLPSLGLAPATFARLAASVGQIYHAAADVDWIQPYDALRTANVAGTRELLRLACTGPAKAFHFVSSLGVCYNTSSNAPATETEDPLDGLAGLHLGYAQSKCVAEALVREAGRRGLPVTIFRPALVSGDSRSGVSNADDLISLFIRGCIRMGAAPDLDWAMDSVPADFLARSMVALSEHARSGGSVYHVANSSPRHWRECVLWMRVRGYPIELLSYGEWTKRLKVAGASPDHPLYGLRSFFLSTVSDQDGLSLPELYEECRRRPP
jgi:thioester reductase-like protein